MKKTSLFLTAVLTLCMSVAASAQQLKVATGSAGKTYSTMFNQLGKVCNDGLALIEQNTGGSMENINLLTGNEVNAAFVQSDVLFFRANTEDLGNIKTLVSLHPEEVHLVAIDRGAAKNGKIDQFASFVGLGDAPPLNTVKDLAGKKVGAIGGSSITAKVIRLQGEINYNVLDHYANDAALLAALGKGEIDAALIVMGQDQKSGTIAGLKGAYKLLSFPPDTTDKLKNVYRPARLTYTNIRQAGVATVAVDALFVTREYKTAKFTEALGKLRGCFLNSVGELAETTGMHPKWQTVKTDNKGKWAYYELPTVAAAAPAKKGK